MLPPDRTLTEETTQQVSDSWCRRGDSSGRLFGILSDTRDSCGFFPMRQALPWIRSLALSDMEWAHLRLAVLPIYSRAEAGAHEPSPVALTLPKGRALLQTLTVIHPAHPVVSLVAPKGPLPRDHNQRLLSMLA